ncbi:MAG: hypothetical protein M1826_002469 [Phylliscum demangeonii]|nr:MAG: hypothetical protein M1826_002469 [Phylliscum demangeonii]
MASVEPRSSTHAVEVTPRAARDDGGHVAAGCLRGNLFRHRRVRLCSDDDKIGAAVPAAPIKASAMIKGAETEHDEFADPQPFHPTANRRRGRVAIAGRAEGWAVGAGVCAMGVLGAVRHAGSLSTRFGVGFNCTGSR